MVFKRPCLAFDLSCYVLACDLLICRLPQLTLNLALMGGSNYKTCAGGHPAKTHRLF